MVIARSILFSNLLFFAWGSLPGANIWENPSVLQQNREPSRAYAHQYTDHESALSFEREQSILQLLNGDWQFHWARTPEESPADFFKAGCGRSA